MLSDADVHHNVARACSSEKKRVQERGVRSEEFGIFSGEKRVTIKEFCGRETGEESKTEKNEWRGDELFQ